MASNNRQFFDGSLGSQEEAVRDLFNQLFENETAGKKAGNREPEKEAVLEDVRIEPDPEMIESEQETVEPIEPEAEAESETVEPIEPETQAEPVSVWEEDFLPTADAYERDDDVPETEDPNEMFAPTFVPPAPYVVQYEEDDMPQELPRLILATQFDDDEDEEDQFASMEDFIFPHDAEEEEEQKDVPQMQRNPFAAIWNALCANVPLPKDGVGQVVRKSVFWVSIVLIAGALTYILHSVWWLPAFTDKMYDGVAQNYHPEQTQVVTQSGYPEGMLASFQTLYGMNSEVRGWISYHADGEQDFLDIDYPIMYAGNNEKYLTVDFNGNPNKNGALFFDMRAKLNSAKDANTALIVYGHNMASGQMLAGLNKFIGNVNNARVASMLTMNTLFEQGEYKVFAVVLTDEDAQGEQYFNIRRTQFSGDDDFMQYVEQIRERSLFDYPVDVLPGDELLLLSTCTAPSSAKIDNGRLTVVARKVRANEIAVMNTSAIVRNDDVIMPYAWYTRQNKTPHANYINDTTADTTTTTATTTTLTSTEAGTSDETVQGDETTTTTTVGGTGTTTSSAATSSTTESTTSTESTTESTSESTSASSTVLDTDDEADETDIIDEITE